MTPDTDPARSEAQASLPGHPAPISRLPNELLVLVLKKAPDFTSLNGLIGASARLSALFRENAHDVVEAVLGATVPGQSGSVMRAVLQVRTARSFGCGTWSEAPGFPLRRDQSPPPISPEAPPGLLRSFVALADRIRSLAHSCLGRCLALCGSRLVLPMAPASCAEEHRVVLGFWLLQYFFEIKAARLKGRLDWTAEDLSQVQFATLDDLWSSTHSICYQYALTAYDFVQELWHNSDALQPPLNTAWSSSSRQHRLPAPTDETHGFVSATKCQPACVPADSRTHGQQSTSAQITLEPERPARMQASQNPARLLGVGFVDGLDNRFHSTSEPRNSKGSGGLDLSEDTAGWRTFVRLRHRGHYMPQTLIGYVGFEPYRKMGLAVWDEQRMLKLGLWEPGPLDGTGLYDVWIDILDKDELAQAVARREKDENEDEW